MGPADLATVVGVSEEQFRELLVEHPEVSLAIREGYHSVRREVVEHLRRKSKAGDFRATCRVLELVETVEKDLRQTTQPLTRCILPSNQSPEEYRERWARTIARAEGEPLIDVEAIEIG